MPQKTRAVALAAALSITGSLAATAAAGREAADALQVRRRGQRRGPREPRSAERDRLQRPRRRRHRPRLADRRGRPRRDHDLAVLHVQRLRERDRDPPPERRTDLLRALKSRRFAVGTHVRQGQRIGRLGKSSAKYTFKAHLHYEQRNASGSAVQARFNGHVAAPYFNRENPTLMRSHNGC